ncbi:acyl carrier protein [Salinispora arenicola]|uniref:acyl carrier protein n=1 Tax=Salinispora arenicola TaxID=168697 RepID=UPI000366B72F|nr:phosphopantetheine-binding protein [Salinispora arenicola]
MTEATPAVRVGLETTIGEIFADLLGMDGPVDPNRSFFQLGGTSVLAARLAARIGSRYQVRLPLRAVFERPTVREVAALVEAEVRGGIETLTDAEVLTMTRGTSS